MVAPLLQAQVDIKAPVSTVWALGVVGSTAWRTRLDNGSITTIGLRRGTPQLVRFNAVPELR